MWQTQFVIGRHSSLLDLYRRWCGARLYKLVPTIASKSVFMAGNPPEVDHVLSLPLWHVRVDV